MKATSGIIRRAAFAFHRPARQHFTVLFRWCSIQAEVLNLLDRIRGERGLTYILVSHDLAVVAHMCERLLVMQNELAVKDLTRAALQSRQAGQTRDLLTASEGYRR